MERQRSWLAPLARLELEQGVGQDWSWTAGVEAAVSVKRFAYGILVEGQEEEVWTPSWLSVRGLLAVARRW